MSELFTGIMQAIEENVPVAEMEYIGKDGLKHCAKCNAATQYRVVVEALHIDRIVRCICDCEKKKIAEEEMRKTREEQDRKRRICFAETNMASWTFENDDRKLPTISNAMQRYVENFPKYLKDGKGLLMYGTVGTGKTYYASCIANRLIDRGYNVKMTNFARLTNQIQGTFEKQEVIDELSKYHLVVIDDLGAERQNEYMQEMVFNIIDSRYRSGKPFIITTNLPMSEIKQPKDIRYSRIYDRIIERCFPVEVAGVSRRRQEVRNTYETMRNELGL